MTSGLTRSISTACRVLATDVGRAGTTTTTTITAAAVPTIAAATVASWLGHDLPSGTIAY